MTFYSWEEQLRIGKLGEKVLDSFFKQSYDVVGVSIESDLKGIDRIVSREDIDEEVRVEYKTDILSFITRNVFIETCKRMRDGVCEKRGWFYYSESDWLVYYIPQEDKIIITYFDVLRRWYHYFGEYYPTGVSQNKSYQSEGVLMPVEVLESLSFKVYDLSEYY